MNRHTVIVEGGLSLHGQRASAARMADNGRDILSLPGLAARLAGGYSRPADQAMLVPLIAEALSETAFEELEAVRDRPGMARAVLASLRKVWAVDLRLGDQRDVSPRLRDLARIEAFVREHLPAGAFLLPDLCDQALKRAAHAPRVTGSLHLSRLITVDPLWRPLLLALARVVDITWDASGQLDRGWFPGRVDTSRVAEPEPMICHVCADPRAEVVEALRWARALLSDGVTRAADIAITSADLSVWDDHMLVLASDAGLPVHFANGVSALSTPAGQTCAALADAMVNGVSQDRIRRLSLMSPVLAAMLPADWMKGVPTGAGLFEAAHWARVLATLQRPDGVSIAPILMPVLHALADGPGSAAKLGELLLQGKSLGLWQTALRLAPAAAVEMTLTWLRVADDSDPANSIVWARADDLVGAPRRYMRLLGLSSRSWPRDDDLDPLLPDHVLEGRRLVDLPRLERDRLAFSILTGEPGARVSLSRSRRSGEGAFLAKSALLRPDVVERFVARTRTPEHAFSEGDRLLARPLEALALPRMQSVVACWTNWTRQLQVTSHDGGFRADHPTVLRALARPQSATALRRLLRDPLGYVWLRALGMTAPELAVQPLQLDAVTFGELVHELLRRALEQLEPSPGLVRAKIEEVDAALDDAARTVAEEWPLSQAVPPRLLWLDTIAEARRRARRGLTVDERFGTGTRSFSEVPFGVPGETSRRTEPWRTDLPVRIGRSGMLLSGRMDRVDVKPDRRGVRISDYKTGTTPRDVQAVHLDGGAEIQRTLYAIATKQLIPEASTIISRLVYLDTLSTPAVLEGDALQEAEDALLRFLDIATDTVRGGVAHPGPDAFAGYNDLRLALPAAIDRYQRRKEEAFNAAHADLAPLWSMQ